MWPAPNSSGGFLDEMFDLWSKYKPHPTMALLAGEGRDVSDHIRRELGWSVKSVNFNPSLNPDICTDMCAPGWITPGEYDLIINQANLEHVYDPFGMCKELTRGMALGGIHVLHTHTQGVCYHPWPRDYFRFERDWFEDLPRHLHGAVALRHVETTGANNVFAVYEKTASE